MDKPNSEERISGKRKKGRRDLSLEKRMSVKYFVCNLCKCHVVGCVYSKWNKKNKEISEIYKLME